MAGLNISHDGRHSAAWLKDAGADGARFVLNAGRDMRMRVAEFKAQGMYVLPVFTAESAGGFNGELAALEWYRDHYGKLFDGMEVGNEPDLVSESSETLSQHQLSTRARTARYVFPNLPLICGGLASGHAEWLAGVDLSYFNYLGVHPYAKDATPGNDVVDAFALIADYKSRYGLPVIVSEWGWWGDAIRGEYEVRDFTRWCERSGQVERFFYFCADDQMVAPFGLYDGDGRPKPAARAFWEESVWRGAPIVQPDSPDVGWIGDGLKKELDELDWTPTSGEHDETLRLVRAKTLSSVDGIVVWDADAGVARSYVSTKR